MENNIHFFGKQETGHFLTFFCVLYFLADIRFHPDIKAFVRKKISFLFFFSFFNIFQSNMPSIALTPEQEKVRQNLYFSSGLKGAAIGLGLGVAATAFTLRRSPEFRALSRPIQSIMAASSKYNT